MTQVIPAVGGSGGMGAPKHGQAAQATRQHAAQEVGLLGIVPKREAGVAGQLSLGTVVGRLID
jgi:hypothetical protein